MKYNIKLQISLHLKIIAPLHNLVMLNVSTQRLLNKYDHKSKVVWSEYFGNSHSNDYMLILPMCYIYIWLPREDFSQNNVSHRSQTIK